MSYPADLSEDKRLFERFSAKFPAKFKDSRESFGTRVSLRDVSAQGAKIDTTERFYLNDCVSIEVKLPDGIESLKIRGEVVWCKNVDSNISEFGIKFYETKFMQLSRLFKYSS